MGVGTGHGKLLLFGEHAAVYGHPALGIQLDATLTITFDAADEWELHGIPDDALDVVTGAVREAARILGSDPRPGRLSLSGSLPTAVGFGSSAALCIGLLSAMDDTGSLSGDRMWSAAHELEHLFHGTPSGIDTGLALFPGASMIYPDPPLLPRREAALLPPMRLIVGALPRETSTADLVRGIRELRGRDEAWVNSMLETLGQCSRDAATAVDASAVGELARQAHGLLCELGLGTAALDAALDAATEAGALGGKLSGAGGGGAFWAVFPPGADTKDAEALVTKKTAGTKLVYLRSLDIGVA